MKFDDVDEKHLVYGLLFSLSNRIQTIGDKDLKDITIKQHFLMIALGMFDNPPTLKEMGDLIGCSYQNVKRMTEQLQKKGYLHIVQDQKDKRKLLLVSTGKLEESADHTSEMNARFMEILYRDIEEQALETTVMTLKKMDHNLGGVIV